MHAGVPLPVATDVYERDAQVAARVPCTRPVRIDTDERVLGDVLGRRRRLGQERGETHGAAPLALVELGEPDPRGDDGAVRFRAVSSRTTSHTYFDTSPIGSVPVSRLSRRNLARRSTGATGP